MKTCPNCHLESALRHGDEGDCVDALRASLDEALALAKENGERAERAEARCAKLEASVQTQTVATFPDAERVRELEIILAEGSGASAELQKLFFAKVREVDALRAELERKDAALWEIDDACAADENVPYIQSLAQAALARSTGGKESSDG